MLWGSRFQLCFGLLSDLCSQVRRPRPNLVILFCKCHEAVTMRPFVAGTGCSGIFVLQRPAPRGAFGRPTSSWRQRPAGHRKAAQTAVQARVDGFIPSDARFGKQRCRWRRVRQVDPDIGETRKSSGRAAPHAIEATRRARAVRWQHASPRQPFLCKI